MWELYAFLMVIYTILVVLEKDLEFDVALQNIIATQRRHIMNGIFGGETPFLILEIPQALTKFMPPLTIFYVDAAWIVL